MNHNPIQPGFDAIVAPHFEARFLRGGPNPRPNIADHVVAASKRFARLMSQVPMPLVR